MLRNLYAIAVLCPHHPIHSFKSQVAIARIVPSPVLHHGKEEEKERTVTKSECHCCSIYSYRLIHSPFNLQWERASIVQVQCLPTLKSFQTRRPCRAVNASHCVAATADRCALSNPNKRLCCIFGTMLPYAIPFDAHILILLSSQSSLLYITPNCRVKGHCRRTTFPPKPYPGFSLKRHTLIVAGS